MEKHKSPNQPEESKDILVMSEKEIQEQRNKIRKEKQQKDGEILKSLQKLQEDYKHILMDLEFARENNHERGSILKEKQNLEERIRKLEIERDKNLPREPKKSDMGDNQITISTSSVRRKLPDDLIEKTKVIKD